jgi:hypothetical protein
MLKQNLEWELKYPVEWSTNPDGYFYQENPELDEKGFWTEEHLKEELRELNHFAHTKGESGVAWLIRYLLRHNWTFIEIEEELKISISFNQIKHIYEVWENVTTECSFYRHEYYCEDAYNVICKAKSGGERSCNISGEKNKCKLFKSHRNFRPFMTIVKEVDHT